jgi:hypothetical protein
MNHKDIYILLSMFVIAYVVGKRNYLEGSLKIEFFQVVFTTVSDFLRRKWVVSLSTCRLT